MTPALYRRELERYAYRLTRSREEAEDLAQEALVRAWVAQPDDWGARAWLRRVVHNLHHDRTCRSAHRGPETVSLDAPCPDGGLWSETVRADAMLSVEEQAIRRVQLAQIVAALPALRPGTRAAVALRYLEGAEYAEIAETLGIGVAAARLRVRYGLRYLRRELAG